MMELSLALANDLTLLSDALGEECVDMAPQLDGLIGDLSDSLTGAIPGYLGLIVTVLIDGFPVVISTLAEEDSADAGGSLLLTLLPGIAAATGTVVFYSGGTGAFAHLADSARWIFNLDRRPAQDTFPSAA